MGFRDYLELSQVSSLKEVDWRSNISISSDISKSGFWVTWLTHGLLDLLNDVINQYLLSRAILGASFNFILYMEVEILTGYSSANKQKSSCRYNKHKAT